MSKLFWNALNQFHKKKKIKSYIWTLSRIDNFHYAQKTPLASI